MGRLAAGSMGDETHRMAQYMVQAFQQLQSGRPPVHEVTPAMLQTMA